MSRKELTRFALLVGLGFIGLGLVALARGAHYWVYLSGIGGGLLLGGIVWPAALAPVYRGWMAVGHAMGLVTTPVFMAVIFFGVLLPVGVILRLTGKRPIRIEASRGQWIRRKPSDDPAAAMERQF